ncbi:hypothetical protein l11_18410 [Neisseria weaveri LMG 5135]|nr:hypothetical protein l11_18410 [Neisseria weaveri LMG 5135]EGV37553.1 hypothetical protein l13_03480 [Neisseria weaveri ATCC 51223]
MACGLDTRPSENFMYASVRRNLFHCYFSDGLAVLQVWSADILSQQEK